MIATLTYPPLSRNTAPGNHRAAVAGFLGGLAGTVAMSLFEQAWSSLADAPNRSRRLRHAGRGSRAAQSEPRSHEKPGSTSEQLVDAASRKLLGREPSERLRHFLGSAFHYAFGAGAGTIYGTLAPRYPKLTFGHGALYGLLVWLAADEILVPSLRLADPPWRSPLRLHVYSIGAHLAYGWGLDATRRLISNRAHKNKAHG